MRGGSASPSARQRVPAFNQTSPWNEAPSKTRVYPFPFLFHAGRERLERTTTPFSSTQSDFSLSYP